MVEPKVMAWLDEIPDPELPAVSITDLGIVRDVHWTNGGSGELVVGLTPTYSGCPATEVIASDVLRTIREHGIANVRVETRLSPPWSTDWITERGRQRLRENGIAFTDF